MKLYALDIPEAPAALVSWIEDHLAGCHLREVVAELAAVHGGLNPAKLSVSQLLGPQLDKVLAAGLDDVPPDTLRQLLRNPGLLLELQELILRDGSAFWDDRLTLTVPTAKAIMTSQRRFMAQHASTSLHGAEFGTTPVQRRTPILSGRWVMAFAAAAAVVIGIFFVEHFGQTAAWGWNKPGAFPSELSAQAYLQKVADEANEWFDERPETRAALAQRVSEFRQGCTALLLAKHGSLSDADREWLKERCRAWATKFDKHLEAAEGGAPLQQVQNETDKTVNKLVELLRERAQAATGRAELGHRLTRFGMEKMQLSHG